MQLAPLVVGYELSDRGVVAIFAWLDVAAVDSPNGMRVVIVPSTLLFTLSAN